MKETTNNCRASRAHNPFDDGARERLRRMGLLTETGSIEASALTALAHTFAGLLFDDCPEADIPKSPSPHYLLAAAQFL